MEPTSCYSMKRKDRVSTTSRENIKKLKTELNGSGGNGPAECERLPASPRISVPFSGLQEPMTLTDLTELLQFAALGKGFGVDKPSWCRLSHQRRLKGVNVVVVDGLTQSDFYKHYVTFRHLRANYSTRLSFTPASTNLASEIFSCEVPESDTLAVSKSRQESSQLNQAAAWHPVIRRFGTKTRGLTAYTLTQEEMIKKRFPVKGLPGFEGFACTDSAERVTDSSPLYGLDCEMCLTVKGYELTRVSLVGSDGKCLLDDLVKPQNRILNYLTRFSGITAAMLQPISTTLREVQAKIRKLLPPDAVLVGHSLENDLVALNLIHPHVVDTSLLYRKEFGQKFKLKVLADIILQKQIQNDERIGHDPTEDATAALELAQYFIKTGPQQVLERHLEELWGICLTGYNEDAVSASTPTPTQPPHSNRFEDVLRRSGQSVAYLGKRADVSLALSNQQWHSSDREVLWSFKRKTTCPSFSVLQFSDHLSSSSFHQEQLHHTVCARLREMCVVFAGSFPAGYGERDVRRLFRRCGAVRRIRMLNTALRLHAEIEFKLLEGAELAVQTLNGLNVHGHRIKVQRPCHESTLDLNVTMEALQDDPLNSRLLYVVAQRPDDGHAIAKTNGHVPDIAAIKTTNGSQQSLVGGSMPELCSERPRTVNGTVGAKTTTRTTGQFHHHAASSSPGTSEDELREAFSRFGAVKRILLPAKPSGKRARHAYIKFESSEGVHAALSSSQGLWNQKYLVCRSLTPPHLRSWAPRGTAPSACEGESLTHSGSQETTERVVRKLDHRLGKLFRCLPDSTLSVVVLPGHSSSNTHLPGLCFMEVKPASS